MNIITNLDGGDLGRGNGLTTFENIPIVIETVGNIFSQLRNEIQKPMILSYGIEVSSHYKNIMEPLLLSMELKGLPNGCKFYQTDGRKIFEVRGYSGGVISSCIFYLICSGIKE